MKAGAVSVPSQKCAMQEAEVRGAVRGAVTRPPHATLSRRDEKGCHVPNQPSAAKLWHGLSPPINSSGVF